MGSYRGGKLDDLVQLEKEGFWGHCDPAHTGVLPGVGKGKGRPAPRGPG